MPNQKPRRAISVWRLVQLANTYVSRRQKVSDRENEKKIINGYITYVDKNKNEDITRGRSGPRVGLTK